VRILLCILVAQVTQQTIYFKHSIKEIQIKKIDQKLEWFYPEITDINQCDHHAKKETDCDPTQERLAGRLVADPCHEVSCQENDERQSRKKSKEHPEIRDQQVH
jgi:hypothetical protein